MPWQSGHGARPHEAIDAVVVTGYFITAVQSLISRHVNPVWPSVITIGSVHAGTAANIIAGHAALEGIIRTTRPDTREEIIDGLHRAARSLGELYRARIDVTLRRELPAVVNTRRETAVATAAARDVVSADGLVVQEHPSMGAEDFSYFLQGHAGMLRPLRRQRRRPPTFRSTIPASTWTKACSTSAPLLRARGPPCDRRRRLVTSPPATAKPRARGLHRPAAGAVLLALMTLTACAGQTTGPTWAGVEARITETFPEVPSIDTSVLAS